MTIMTIMTIIIIIWIIIYFQCWDKCTVKCFGPCVGLWCGRKKEQNPRIPNWIWRDHEGSIINARRQNHYVVQSVAAVKWFCRELVAVNALHTTVLGVAKHQTVVQCEMALALPWICQFQCLQKSIYLNNNQNNYNITNNFNKEKRNICTILMV